MPIQLNQLNATPKIKFSPKFFDKNLTGSGKKQGLLCEAADPKNKKATNIAIDSRLLNTKKTTYVNGNTTIHQIPLTLFHTNLRVDRDLQEIKIPDRTTMLCAGTGKNAKEDVTVYVDMLPYALLLEEIVIDKDLPPKREFSASYQINVFTEAVTTGQKPTNETAVYETNLYAKSGQTTYTRFLTDVPVKVLMDDIPHHAMRTLQAYGCKSADIKINTKEISDYIDQYSLHTGVQRISEIWQTTADEQLAPLFKTCANLIKNNNSIAEHNLVRELQYIETYNIPLDTYRRIYNCMKSYFTQDQMRKFCKYNLNLLLSDTMDSLHQNKPNLNRIQTPQNVNMDLSHYSLQQKNAITTTEPLTLVQSGAGTGKALAVSEPVLTANGWKRMGDITMDDMVAGSDGKFHKITHITDQGIKPGYRITFRDKSSVICDKDHLWTMHAVRADGHVTVKTQTAKEWKNDPSLDKFFVPQGSAIDFPEKELPLDPYLLGALIADGSLHNHTIDYAKNDENTIQAVKEAAKRNGFEMYECTTRNQTVRHFRFHAPVSGNSVANRLNRILTSLNLRVKSVEKFIPETYFTASIEQRIMLVHGLFDGDGKMRPTRNYARYSTKSQRLADDVLQLLWSLGLEAKKTIHKHKKGNYWSVDLFAHWDPFMASPLKGQPIGAVKNIRRSIISFEEIEPTQMRCIGIDSDDHLYVTKDYLLTHNSTVILGRIQYMVEAGVKPEDITVLSFTNAAADHIRELNPNVHSMTIASMIHTIYTENYPNHELSSIDTMMNSIDIYFGTSNQTAIDFRYKLKDIIRNESDAFTKMNNFVEANFDEIIHIMDTIKQTCLEMEIIVCYQKIGILKEPDTITSKHLIIDEVQDNSIFEFIYTLKYVDKHGESLYIVGDCSQTLYEFRASNPKALNVLEGSGVFQTYQLQINYRSNQEILDFANVVLKNIEANQYAHIQLQANSLAKVTEQSFRDKVKLHYERMPRITEFEKSLPAILAKEVKPYLDEKLKAGEQVAFLAYTRKTIKNIQSFLETIYPDKTVVSLVPDKMYNSTIFSEYIKRFWDGAKFLPTKDIANIIMRQINDNLYQLTYSADRVRPTVQKMLADWFNEQNPNIQIWYNQMNNKVITKDQYMQAVKECMLEYEIRSNAIRQSLLSARNKANKENEAVKSANFVLSTIHSAKGLEFENTVVIYRDESAMEEDKKRMYYVAFTRAMKSEFILAYNTVFSPKIEGDYNALIDLLKQKDAASGVNSDDDTTGASASDEMTDEERQEKLQNISAQMQDMRDQLLGKKTEE